MERARKWSATAMAIEEFSYTVTTRNEPIEVRECFGYVVAETLVDGDGDSIGNVGCRRMFAFISGANRGEAKVAMTAPVEQQRAEKRWRVAFVLPAIYSLATAPRPAG